MSTCVGAGWLGFRHFLTSHKWQMGSRTSNERELPSERLHGEITMKLMLPWSIHQLRSSLFFLSHLRLHLCLRLQVTRLPYLPSLLVPLAPAPGDVNTATNVATRSPISHLVLRQRRRTKQLVPTEIHSKASCLHSQSALRKHSPR